MNIQAIQEEIIDEFSMFDDWDERFQYVIDLGKSLPLIDEKFKTEDNIIKGCQSKVWLHAEEKNGLINFTADSDGYISKGVISILVRVFSNQKAVDILESNTDFINKIELQQFLSPNRANGLSMMIKQIKLYALGLEAKNK